MRSKETSRVPFDQHVEQVCADKFSAHVLYARCTQHMLSHISQAMHTGMQQAVSSLLLFSLKCGWWQPWSELLPAPQIPAGAQFPDIFIPTKDSARYTFLLAAALRQGYPLLFIGPTGPSFSV